MFKICNKACTSGNLVYASFYWEFRNIKLRDVYHSIKHFFLKPKGLLYFDDWLPLFLCLIYYILNQFFFSSKTLSKNLWQYNGKIDDLVLLQIKKGIKKGRRRGKEEGKEREKFF